MGQKRDYYEILGADRNASDEELKRLYRKLSLQYHPDRQAGKSEAEKKDAEEKFKEVNEAYSVLSDPEKRGNYDRFGSADGGSGGFSSASVDPFEFFRKMHSGFGFGAGDGCDFDGGWGGFGFGDGGRSGPPDINAPEDGADIQTKVYVTFKESVFGCTKELDFDLDKACPDCGGTGAEKGSSPEKCGQCRGRGRVARISRMGPMVQQTVTDCPECRGTGYSVKPCRACGGRKRVADRKHVKVKIPAGFRDGQRLRLKGLGRCGLKGGTDGDLYVVVRTGESGLFVRDGDDILVRVYISPAVASLGGKIDVPTLYGYRKVKIEPGTRSGTRLKVAGAGVRPADGGAGDLVIDVSVEPYSSPSVEQKELLEKLRKTESVSDFEGAKAVKKLADEFYA